MACRDVRKSYMLYQSTVDMALDRIGLRRFVERRRGKPIATKEALAGIDLTVRKGERVGIIGRNGAGKTTLLKLIAGRAAGTLAPTSGTIEVDGRVQALMRMGEGFHPDLSGAENARAALVDTGYVGPALEAAVAEVANFAELGLFLHRPMKTYSLGMGARLQFAVATTLQAEILIVDEVLGAGDAYFLAKSAERMRRLVDSGRTLLLVSHSIEQVMLYADRIVWIHGGRIVQDGPAAEVAAAYASFATEASESPAHGPVATSRRFLPAVPAHARAAFVRSMIARAEQGSGTDGGETWVDLPSGLKGLRRTPASGARITDVRVSAVSISDTLLQVADAVTVTIDVAADRPMEDLRVALEVYALNGTPMTLMCSPAFSMGENGGRTVSVEIAPALFGAREYLLSIAIESSAHDARECETADRLSQVVYLPFANINDADPPLMHHPAGWFFGNGVAAVPGRIKAVQ